MNPRRLLLGFGALVLIGLFFATASGGGIASGAMDAPQPCCLGDPPPARYDECVSSLDLSSVDVVAGQSANQSTAAVTISNQSTNGSTVIIESARLPEGGFIALQSSSYVDGLESRGRTVIAVSKYLKPGNYTNLSLNDE